MILLLRHLDRARFAPTLCVHDAGGPFSSLVPDDVPVVDLQKGSKWDAARLIRATARQIRSSRPDVIYSKLEYANIVTHFAARAARARVPLVMGEEANLRDTLHLTPHARVRSFLLRRAYRAADVVVSPSRGAASVLKGRYTGARDPVVIPNMVDLDEVRTNATTGDPYRVPADDLPLVVSVGRLAAEKGLPYLIRAIATVVRTTPCRLLVIGDGAERPALERLVHDLALEDTVVFAGYQANPFVTMARADVLVMSSLWESFGNILIEGMALGLAVLSTTAAFGPDEIIDHGETGWLVPPANAAALSDALTALLADGALRARLGERAREASARFEARERVQDYESLFQGLRARGATRRSLGTRRRGR